MIQNDSALSAIQQMATNQLAFSQAQSLIGGVAPYGLAALAARADCERTLQPDLIRYYEKYINSIEVKP